MIQRILIVADERQLVDELLEYFDLRGYETEIALNSKIALAIIAEREMHLVIVGFQVQETMCTDIINEIRKNDLTIPIIVINGKKSKRIQNAVIKAGASRYIPGPVEKGLLLKAVKGIRN